MSVLFLCSFIFSACTQPPARVVHHDAYSPRGKQVTWSHLKSSSHVSPDTLSKKGNVKDTGRIITVKKGDSVYELAKRYRVTSRDIIQANSLRPPYRISAGKKLKIPSHRYHKVRQGESIYKISRTYNVDMTSLVEANGIKRPYPIAPGQWLVIPSATADEKITRSYQAKTLKTKPKLMDKGRIPAKQMALSRKKDTNIKPVQNYGVFRSASGSGKFGWPVRGSILAGFGPQKAGVYNDGINIRVKEGEKVLSAEDGEVVYTGKGLKGYGNMLIIKHRDGYITAYAHNREIVVRKGQRVKRGQVVSYAGATGNVDSPQLHFAIRRGKKALDPLEYLAG